MQVPKEFELLSRLFVLELPDDVGNPPEAWVDYAASHLSREERAVVKDFLDDLLSQVDDDQELIRIWTTSGADCWVPKMRPFFEMLRDRMDSPREAPQPRRDRKTAVPIPDEFKLVAQWFEMVWVDEIGENPEALIRFALKHLSREDIAVGKRFLDDVLDRVHDERELQRIWGDSGAGFWVVIDGKTRPFLEMLRDRMAPPA